MAFMREPLYVLMQDGKVRIHNKGYGLVVDQTTFDELVMMRYYNMTEQERRTAIACVLETQFETGADGVREASGLPTVMERVAEQVDRMSGMSRETYDGVQSEEIEPS